MRGRQPPVVSIEGGNAVTIRQMHDHDTLIRRFIKYLDGNVISSEVRLALLDGADGQHVLLHLVDAVVHLRLPLPRGGNGDLRRVLGRVELEGRGVLLAAEGHGDLLALDPDVPGAGALGSHHLSVGDHRV